MVTAMTDPTVKPERWIRFLRKYGPVPQNENMYDEHIRRSARFFGVKPIDFQHPASGFVLEAITGPSPISVILTGTAGDGKTHLCRQVWEAVGGSDLDWQYKQPYLSTALPGQGQDIRMLHMVTDLSAWVPQRNTAWDPGAKDLLQRFSTALFPPLAASRPRTST